MAKKSQAQSSRMLKYKTILTNVRASDMLDPLAQFGYDTAVIDEGDALYTTAADAIKVQKQAISDRLKSTRALNILEKAIQGTYMTQVKMARRALSDAENHIKDLGIIGERERILAKWTDEASVFYNTALASPDILASLSRFNIDETALQTGLDDISGLLELNSQQEDKKGIAQQKTEAKKAAVKALEKWIADLLIVCRIAYIEDPQKMERLTITVYSEGYKKKKDEPDPGTEPPTEPTDPGAGTEPTGGETPAAP